MKKSAFVYSDKLQSYDYGAHHPLKMVRLRLTYELLKEYGAFLGPEVELVEAEPCTQRDAETVHYHEYLDVLNCIDHGVIPEELGKYGLGHGDNPAFKGVYAGSMLSTGASMQAARIVHEGLAGSAFNISGGLHHAMPRRASGFCYINDPAVAIKWLVGQGRKVAYIDIDAHHGDGVEHIFYDTDQVLTVSLHEDGNYLFPGTGFADIFGVGKGRGYAVNLPFIPGTGDEVFRWGFFELIPQLMDLYRPDIVVAQLGCDTFATDPLTHLQLTTNGFIDMVKGFRDLGLPWVALGGGGYDVTNVARAWSLAFGVMAGIELPAGLPEGYKEILREERLPGGELLRDEPIYQDEKEILAQRQAAESALLTIKHEVLPLVRGKR